MTNIDDRLREWLELTDADELVSDDTFRAPPSSAHTGRPQRGQAAVDRTRHPEELIPDAVVSRLRRRPEFDVLDLGGPAEECGVLRQWAVDRVLYRYAPGTAAYRLMGVWREIGPGDLVADADLEPAAVGIVALEGETVMALVGGRPERKFVRRAAVDAAALLDGWRPPVGDTFGVPSTSELLGGTPCPAWLAEWIAPLEAAPALSSRLVAAGRLARLWTPTQPGDHGEGAAGTAPDVGESPGRRLADWSRALSATHAAHAERLALDALADFAERVSIAAERLESGSDGDDDAPFWRDLVRRRDDLASLRFILVVRKGSEAFDQALAPVEREAAALVDRLVDVPGLGDQEWLRAVGWQEPEAWWGALAEY